MSRSVQRLALAVVLFAIAEASAFAQSGIAGVVRDTSGAVLPGVTVEAASPALIEKVRAVVTDDSGQYRIVDLRPGVYSVTFALAGFNSMKRDGIELPASFTANVNADLQVGSIEQLVTVTGAAPVVDVQNVFQQSVLSKEVLDAIPTSRLPQNVALLVPGVSLGRLASYQTGLVNTNNGAVISVHGNRGGESAQNLDGFPTRNTFGPGGSSFYYYVNAGSTQEVVVTTGSAGAEQQMSGVVTNSILRDGGNRFTTSSYFHFSNESLLSDNLTDKLKAQGVTSGNSNRRQWDVNPSFGGPLKKDKIWFFASVRSLESMADAGIRYNLTPQLYTYTPDLSQKTASEEAITQNYAIRPSWQVTPRHQVSGYFDWQPRDVLNSQANALQSPEASGHAPITKNYLWIASWKSPVTNRLLYEVGSSYQAGILNVLPNDKDQRTKEPSWPGVFNAVSSLELNTNLRTRARQNYNRQPADLATVRGAVSYITGTHAFKVGLSHQWGSRKSNQFVNQEYLVSTRNGLPASVTLDASGPFTSKVKADIGAYVQDQWTMKKLTLNAGLRYDYFEGYVPPQDVPANRWVDASHYDAVKGLPKWQDLSPRVGAAYDLFGNGRTALKGSINRYVRGFGGDLVNSINPVNSRVTTANRTWADVNSDFIPDCNMRNPVANGECGPISNTLFGSTNPNAQRFDPEVLTGFGTREYNWEGNLAVNHELTTGISVNAGYFRRWYGNATLTDNLLVSPADNDPFCITAPTDSRLPGGGGNRLCGFYDLAPAKLGQVQSLVTAASNFGEVKEVYDGVDLSIGGRFRDGQITVGTNTGRTVVGTCFAVDSPGTTPSLGATAWRADWCERKAPFQTQYKINGLYRFPWYGLQLSGAFQSNPGPEISATTYVATNAEIRDSLGRNLSAGATATAILPLMEPGSAFASNWSKTDMRLSKIFRFGDRRVTGGIDIFNVFNQSGTILLNTRYGPSWLRPTTIVAARQVRFSAQVDF